MDSKSASMDSGGGEPVKKAVNCSHVTCLVPSRYIFSTNKCEIRWFLKIIDRIPVLQPKHELVAILVMHLLLGILNKGIYNQS